MQEDPTAQTAPIGYPTHLAELDEAVLLLIRKLGNLAPEVFERLAAKIPAGAMEVLMGAEARADAARHADERAGITRTFAP